MKRERFRNWILSSLLLVVIAAFAVGCSCGPAIKETESDAPASSPEETEAPTGEDPLPSDGKIYYNVDRLLYSGMGEGGGSARKRSPGNKLYGFRAVVDGEVKTLFAKDLRTMNQIDSEFYFAAVTDEDGVIIEVRPIEEAGYELVAGRFYVVSIDGTKVLFNSSARHDGMELTLDLKDAGVYNASESVVGPDAKTELEVNDRATILKKKGGDSYLLYVINRVVGITNYCRHCDQEVVWRAWEKTRDIPAVNGHYYLTGNIELNTQANVEADQEVVIDLNGYSIIGGKNRRVIAMNKDGAYLSIVDNSEARTGKLVASGEMNDVGAGVWVRFGRFDLFGGTLDASGMTNHGNGCAVFIHEVGEMHLYDGAVIKGGTGQAFLNTNGKVTGGSGGGIYAAGKFVMHGGKITGGKSYSYTDPKTGSTSGGLGGNLTVYTTGTATISGGTIENGVSEGGGGNIYLAKDAHCEVQNAVIAGGKVVGKSKTGGNVYVGGGSEFKFLSGEILNGRSNHRGPNVSLNGTFLMSGGHVSGGYNLDENGQIRTNEVHRRDRNFYISNGTLLMNGGTIDGFVLVGQKGNVNLSGAPVIRCLTDKPISLYLNPGKTITVGTMNQGANVAINGGGYLTEATAASNRQYFSMDGNAAPIHYVNQKLFAGEFHCVCGRTDGTHFGACDGQAKPFAAWMSVESLPKETGYYALTRDVNPTGQTTVSAVDGKAQDVVISLNGHQVTVADEKRGFLISAGGGRLTITDYGAKSGAITVKATKDQGMGVLVGDTFVMYAGTIDGKGVNSPIATGGTIRVASGGTFTMYGGRIIGGAVKNGGALGLSDASDGKAGGKAVISGGIITGGTASGAGGTVFVGKGASYSESGGTVEKGNAKSGGTLFVIEGGKATLSGGTLKDGTATNHGGNVYVSAGGSFTISGGEISGGTANTDGKSNGGNVYIEKAAVEMTGGTITGGKAYNRGGNVSIGQGATLMISGGIVKDGANVDAEGKKRTALLYHRDHNVMGSGQLIMTGGTIEGSVLIAATGGISLSGNPVIYKEAEEDFGLYLNEGALIESGELGSGAKVRVTLQSGGGIFTKPGAGAGEAAYTTSAGAIVRTADDALAAGNYRCLCNNSVHASWCDGAMHLFSKWNGTDDITTSGYYELTADSSKTIQSTTAERTVFLDLAGHSIVTESGRALNLGGSTFTIVNSLSTGGVLRGNNQTNGSTVNVWGGSRVDFHNVTLEAGPSEVDLGGVFYLSSGQVNLDGCTVNARAVTGVGGAIYVCNSAELTLQSTTVSGGKAVSGGNIMIMNQAKLTLNDTVLKDGQVDRFGGNLYVMDQACAVMNGASVIENGRTLSEGTSSNGGNLYVSSGASFTMNGGEIRNGKALNRGGNASVSGALILNGGKIYGGENVNASGEKRTSLTYDRDHNVMVQGLLSLNGGEIEGSVLVSGTGVCVTLSGAPKVVTGGKNSYGIYLNTGALVDASALDPGAEIEIKLQAGTGIFSGEGQAEKTEYFTSPDDEIQSTGKGELSVGVVRCICNTLTGTHEAWCDGELHSFSAWDGTGDLKSGCFYLTADRTTSMTNASSSLDMVLDLNGHSVLTETGRALNVGGGKVLILNSGESGGVLKGQNTSNGTSLNVWGGACTLVNVSVEPGEVSSIETGGAAYLAAEADFKMYGGSMTGRAAKNGGTVAILGNAKAFFEGTRIIAGSVTARGGAVYLASANASVTFRSCTLTGGVTASENGGILGISSGACTVDSCAFSGGKAKNGGNFIIYGGSLKIAGESVLMDGQATNGPNGFVVAGQTATFSGKTKVQNGVVIVKGTLILKDQVEVADTDLSVVGGTVQDER